MDNRAKATQLLTLIRESDSCTVITGAGVSVASGIQSFRGPDGLWKQYDPNEYCSIRAFAWRPKQVWEMFHEMYKQSNPAKPNIIHTSLAYLEALGDIRGVITMNVDGLHEEAGSQNVIDIHGSLYGLKNVRTKEVFDISREEARDCETTIPYTPDNQYILKPNVILFGELIAPHIIEQVEDLIFSSDTLIVLGSSVTVDPIATLVDVAIHEGIKVVFVNLRDEVPQVPEDKCVKINGPLEDIFHHVGLQLMEKTK